LWRNPLNSCRKEKYFMKKVVQNAGLTTVLCTVIFVTQYYCFFPCLLGNPTKPIRQAFGGAPGSTYGNPLVLPYGCSSLSAKCRLSASSRGTKGPIDRTSLLTSWVGLTRNSAYSQAPCSLIRQRFTCREKSIVRKPAVGSPQSSLLRSVGSTHPRSKRILIFCSPLSSVYFLLILNVKDLTYDIRVPQVTSQASGAATVSHSRRVEWKQEIDHRFHVIHPTSGHHEHF
jgi:hypothetical protein